MFSLFSKIGLTFILLEKFFNLLERVRERESSISWFIPHDHSSHDWAHLKPGAVDLLQCTGITGRSCPQIANSAGPGWA